MVAMTDAQVRALERKWKEGGALADGVAYLSALRRSGAAVEGSGPGPASN